MTRYIPKAQRDRSEWMTLGDVLKHIQKASRIDRDAALSELRHALGDGEIPCRWAADAIPGVHRTSPAGFTWNPSRSIFSNDKVPLGEFFWDTVLILPDGRVVDQSLFIDDESNMPRARQLLLLGKTVLNFWHDAGTVVTSEDGLKPDRLESRAKRWIADDQEILDAVRALYRADPHNPLNEMKAEQEFRSRLARDNVRVLRKIIRPILDREEFASLRRPRGNQPKK